MRKKITMLLASLFACVGVMKADVTKFYKPGERVATLTAGQQVMFYNTSLVVENDAVSQDRTGFLVDNGSSLELSKTKPAQNPVFSEKVGVWTVESVEDNNTYYKVSVKGSNGYVGIGGVTNNAAARDLYIHKWTEVAADKKAGVGSENAAGETVNSGNITASDNVWLVANGDPDNISTTWNGNINSFATWSTGHPYAMYSVVEAETTDLEALLATAKSDALTVLESFANLTISTAATAITEVNAVVLENNDLEAALNAIDAIVANCKKQIDGMSVKFTNCSNGDDRGGKYLGYDKGNNRAAAVASTGDDVIWTIKVQENGSFKLYNFVHNVYLGVPADPTPVIAAEADAPAFDFIVTGEDQVALATGDKMVHIANHSNYKVINYWSTTDKASLWTIAKTDDIVVSREQYVAAAAAKEALPYAIQQAYGLVTDAAKYTSNAPETQVAENSSYTNLLDNNYESYFHSSWSYAVGDHHYLQAEVSEEVESFYFYFKKRKQNENNRPTEIEILGSTDGEDYTIPVATISEGLPTTAGTIDYFSAKITATESVKYLRFVVKGTNNGASHQDDGGHPFFTFSEFYILPAVADVTNLINSYKAFASSSITSEDMATAATALISAETTLALANIKKEAAALLSANESNHAATPELGQYTTEAYDALNAAYEAADATQESLEAAIAAFKKSLNVPVYFITSKHNGYAAGSAILYNGSEWRWAAANKYNKQMWMTIPGYTEENVPAVDAYDAEGTSYAICDYLTGTKMRGKDVQIVKVADWEGAYNLQYNANAESTDAAQHAKDNGQLVNWKPGTSTDAQASVWGVEYIGNTYDLDKLTDEFFAAAADLAAINVPNFSFAAGVNNYDETTKPALDAAVANRIAVLGKLSTAEEIAAAKTQLEAAIAGVKMNMPENGKFYRVRCAGSGMKYLQSTLDETNAEDIRLQVLSSATSVNATFCYIDGALVSYTTGLYINAYRFNEVGVKSDVVFSEASNGKLGAYNITVDGRYIFGAQDNNKIDSGSGTPDNRDGYTWWLEEVTELPVTIGAAGYATFYAPVAVTLPAEVKANTLTDMGTYATLNEEDITVIPANNGVILTGAAGTYNLAISAEAGEDLENALKGTVAKTLVEKNEGDAYYMLVIKEGVAGLYNPVKGDDATKFYNAGFKAYWHLAGATQSATYRIGEETTGIDQLINNGEVVIYDLSGRRVEKMEKGIYIVNGKKVVK